MIFIKLLLLALAFLLALFQATILPVNFLFLLVILTSFWQSGFSFLLAFFSGLALDLVRGTLLGSSSLKFLTGGFLIFWLKNRLPLNQKSRLKLPLK